LGIEKGRQQFCGPVRVELAKATMSLLQQVFGSSHFQPLVEHPGKGQECVELFRLLAEATVNANG